jgi:O-antigen/teichoic acid export membrane protein
MTRLQSHSATQDAEHFAAMRSDSTRSTRRSWALTVGDQVASSLSSIVGAIALARAFDAELFGVFAVAYACLAMAVGCSRAYFGTMLAADASGSDSKKAKYSRAVRALCVIALPIFAASVGLTASLAPLDQTGWVLILVVGAATPLVMLQDVGRYYGISAGRPGGALASDAYWLGVAITLLAGGPLWSDEVAIAVWFAAILGATVISLAAYRPSVAALGWEYDRSTQGVGRSAVGVVALSGATGLAIAAIATATVGAEAAGALRAAGTVFGPINTLMTFLDLAIVALVARRKPTERAKLLGIVAGLAVLATSLWGSVLILTPDQVGRFVLGESWDGARSVLAITALEYVALTLVAILHIQLKVERRALGLVLAKVLSSVAILLAGIAAALLAPTVQNFAVALAVGALVGLVANWAAVRLGRRQTGSEVAK